MKACKDCGTPLEEQATVCPSCRKAVDEPSPTPPMKWYKFLIYFELFASAILNLCHAAEIFLGTAHGVHTQTMYSIYDGLRAVDMTMAVLMIGFILLALTTRFYLAGFYKQGPTLLNVYYIANPVFNLIYLIALTAVLPASARGDAEHNLIGSVLGGVVMLILNKVYFDKRKHLFVNDIQ